MEALPSDIFVRRLRTERERTQVSQAELARRMAEVLETNVDPSAVTRIEQKLRAVRLDEAVAMASVLNIDIAELLSDDAPTDNELLVQQYLADLVVARRQWEKTRREIDRLTRAIGHVSGGYEIYRRYVEQADALEPALKDVIDARVAKADQDDDATGPGA
ncbi:helix-turn-helix domain-containing protein [Arthrobacter castelli]|uniref:helix-turn-helix domain-containing protein n=1 Tax=Arthrobacter castelli TaxID=271431 RepID=UPI000425D235|nr:helix-turn-helix transcriptional regulator [Arthrobacter castelli]